MSSWYLEGFFGRGGSMRKLPLRDFPQTVGRDDSLDYPISYPSVSRRHAELSEVSGLLSITDLGSSNGTFVNHERISEATALNHGDIIHFGDLELRLLDQDHSVSNPTQQISNQTVFINTSDINNPILSKINGLEELIATKAITPAYQPILSANGLKVVGYEALGRGASQNLPVSPLELFAIAESGGLEVKLSDLMRCLGVDIAVSHAIQGDIWVNTHPSEMKNPDGLLASLRKLRQRHPNIPLVFEVHEQCVADSSLLKQVKEELHKLSIRLAFDDFGVGQARLTELVEARPDVIKFDKVLISGIDRADQGRVNMLRHLNQMVSELNIQTLAECVENEAEYLMLKELGFELYQGYYFAKPQAPENINN